MSCCPINFGWQVLTKCKLRAYGGDGNMHKRQVLTGVLVVGLVLFLACVAEEFWRKGNLFHGAVHRSHEVSAYQQHDCSQPTTDILTRSSKGRETKALTLVKTLMSGQHESQWKKRDYMQTSKGKRATEGGRCGRALLKGRRISQEDRIVCVPEIQLQFIGEEHSPQISLLAVFDGHDGHEASELAATSIYPLFLYHVHSIVGDLVSTLCLSDMDTCSQPPETRGQNWHHPVGPQHMHSAQVYDWFCGEGRKNGSSMLLVEQCLDIKAAAMEGLFGAADAVTFSDVAKTMWDATAKQASHKADSQSAKKWDGESLENVRNWMASGKMQGPFLRAILKEALAKAVLEIDAIFSNKARRDGLESGSTACVVLLAEKHLLVANLGDCKALICSSASSCSPPLQQGDCQEDPRVCLRKQRRKKSSQRVRAEGDVQLCVNELTSDHRPDREDEKIRILAAGGFIENSGGVPRVNGRLAVTRSIGDIALKRFGVTAEPELSSWQSIADTDNFIVVASDGVFDKMTPQDVCNTISAVTSGSSMSSAAKNILQPEPAIPLLPRESLKSLEVDSEILAVPKFTVTVQEVKTVSVLPPSQEGKTLSFPKSESLRLDALDFKGMQSLALAESTELETVVEPRQDGVHQQMAQAVVDTALGLGSMDNLAAVVLPLRSLHCLNSEESSVSRGKREDRVMTIDKDKAPKTAQMNGIISPSSDVSAEHVSEKVSRSRQCYELIKALPRQSIIPMYPVPTTIGRVFKREPQVITKPEAKHEGGLLQSIPAYKPDSEDAFCRALSGRGEYEVDVYHEHLVYAPGQSELGQHQEICLRPKGLSQYLSLIGSVPVDTLSLPASERESMSGRPAASSVLPPYMVHHHRYLLKRNIAKGAFGEIWLGVRRECLVGAEESGSFNLLHPEKACNHSSCNNNTEENYFGIWGDAMCLDKAETFIFKRILVEKGSRTFLSGYREKYFGELFLNSYRTLGKEQAQRAPDVNQQSDYQKWRDEGLGHVARYIEAFERSTGNELWLVFRNEGQSLSKLLYVADTSSTNTEAGHFRGFNVLKPSPWWHWLKTTDIGRKEMRNLFKQLLLAVHACHSHNITHRDIKPENMIVKSSSLAGGPLADWPTNLTMHLIDFGSAIDPFTLQNLYGRSGPTQDEQTLEYAPPEALLGRHWIHFHAHRAHVYDIWSVGVVMLELVLGTPHVFQISARTRALLDHRLKGWDQAAKETAYMLRAFMEMCILPPGIPPHRHHRHGDNPADQSEDARLVSFECSDAAFSEQIKQRDPLGIGMPDLSAMRLVRRLLEWYPDDRISALEALQDAYFHEAEDSTNGF